MAAGSVTAGGRPHTVTAPPEPNTLLLGAILAAYGAFGQDYLQPTTFLFRLDAIGRAGRDVQYLVRDARTGGLLIGQAHLGDGRSRCGSGATGSESAPQGGAPYGKRSANASAQDWAEVGRYGYSSSGFW